MSKSSANTFALSGLTFRNHFQKINFCLRVLYFGSRDNYILHAAFVHGQNDGMKLHISAAFFC